MKPYPVYKDSGVEWLGQVPEGWEVVPVKAVATCNDEVLTEGTDPSTDLEYVEISGVDANDGIVETTATKFGAAPSRARRIVRNGDMLISTVRTYLRAIAQVTEAAPNLIASTGFAVLRPKSVSSPFLGHVCRSEYFIAEVIARSVGVSYPAINASQIMALPIPLPPLPEQQAIAAFLDQETAKIDGLIEEQRRLIALLAEKRQNSPTSSSARGSAQPCASQITRTMHAARGHGSRRSWRTRRTRTPSPAPIAPCAAGPTIAKASGPPRTASSMWRVSAAGR